MTSNAPLPLIDFAAAQATLDHLASTPPAGAVARVAAHGRGTTHRGAVPGPRRAVRGLDRRDGGRGPGRDERQAGPGDRGAGLGPTRLPVGAGRARALEPGPHRGQPLGRLQRLGRPRRHRARLPAGPTSRLVLYGPWDVLDRKLPGDDRWRSFGDPVYDAFMRHEMLALVDVLLEPGRAGRVADLPPVRSLPDARRPNEPAHRAASRRASRQGGGARSGRVPGFDRTRRRAAPGQDPPQLPRRGRGGA